MTVPTTEPTPRRRRPLHTVLHLLVVAAFVLFIVYAVAKRWDDVRDYAGRLSLRAAGLSMAAVLGAIWCSFLCWKAVLADFGSHVPVSGGMRIFFIGQLGKYLPGKLWPILTQIRLGAEYRVPKRASGAAAGVFMLLVLGTGLVLAAVTMPFLGGQAFSRYWWTLVVLPVALVAMHPAILNRGLGTALRLAKREPMPRPLTLRGIAVAAFWCLPMWALFGVHTWALALDLGSANAFDLYLQATGVFAASWSIGFVLGVLPAGAGPREAAFILLFGATLPTAQATVLALVSRLLITLGDVAWGLLALIGVRKPPGPAPTEAAATEALPAAPPAPDEPDRARR
jgi:glycosyltransferase 2 family protein